MSRLTNVHGLPQSIVAAVTRDPYTGGGDISTTKLIDAPQVVELGRKHHDQIVVDVSERIWSLLGQGVHTILERAGLRQEGMVAEQRLFAEVMGWQVSGQFDVMDLESKKISDYKVTTVYKAKGNDKWTQQLNVLRWLAHQNGNPVEELEIVAIFRDWRKTEAERSADYPRAAIQAISVPVWDLQDAQDFIEERVALHQASRKGQTVACTDEDRWYSGSKWAIVKPGNTRALKVFDSEPHEGQVPEGYRLEHRPGEYKRCMHYCDVAPFCPQWNGGKDAGC
jgi:hypothetical protein